jgi:hypothetical protein
VNEANFLVKATYLGAKPQGGPKIMTINEKMEIVEEK